MDVSIKGDDKESTDNHEVVSFNPKKASIRIYPGDSRGIVYLNNDEVIGAMELAPYDVIEVGQTKLMFMAFCGERFQWSQ